MEKKKTEVGLNNLKAVLRLDIHGEEEYGSGPQQGRTRHD